MDSYLPCGAMALTCKLGYRFKWGMRCPTRTPTPTKPVNLPQGFPYPCQSLSWSSLIVRRHGNLMSTGSWSSLIVKCHGNLMSTGSWSSMVARHSWSWRSVVMVARHSWSWRSLVVRHSWSWNSLVARCGK